MKFILASASPQRWQLLSALGVPFEVIPSSVDEEACMEKDPRSRALLLASLKARDIAAKHTGRCVIGCDTLVVASDGTLLEKPINEDDARRMLSLQSGSTSLVHSGLSVIFPDGTESKDVSMSRVRFATITPEVLDTWIATKLWEGRSGAFQIDGRGQFLIEHLEGDWTSVVGLPMFLLGKVFRAAGVQFP